METYAYKEGCIKLTANDVIKHKETFFKKIWLSNIHALYKYIKSAYPLSFDNYYICLVLILQHVCWGLKPISIGESPSDVMSYKLNCGLEVREFELHSLY